MRLCNMAVGVTQADLHWVSTTLHTMLHQGTFSLSTRDGSVYPGDADAAVGEICMLSQLLHLLCHLQMKLEI